MGKYDDLGATLAPPDASPTGNKYADLGATPTPSPTAAPSKPDYSDLGAVPIDTAVKNMAADPTFDPASHAAQNPQDAETAYQVYQARKNQGWGDWFKGVGRTLNNPTTYLKAGQGVVNFLGGLGQSIIADPIAHAYYSATGDPRALTKQAEATLEAQHGEESAKGLVNAAIAARPGTYSGGWGESTGDIESELSPEAKDAHERALFAQRVQQAKNALQLEQGRPLDTGAIAGIYHAAGQQPSEEVGPESLTASGAPAVDPGNIERASAASDPTMLALAAAPGLPGVSYLGGRIAQGAGKVAQLPWKGAEVAAGGLKHLGPTGKLVAAAATGSAGVPAVVSAAAHPMAAVVAGAIAAGAKGLQVIGRAAEQQGKELATGVPSELTTNAANAAATGESAIWNNTQRRLGNAAAQGASTAVGMVPLNAALSEGDPNKFAESEVGAGAFGGTLGSFARNRPMMVEAVRPFLRSEGVRALTEASQGNDPLAAKSQAYLMSIPEEARNRALEAIGAIQGLPTDTPNGQVRAKVYVLNDADYRNVIADKFGMQQAAMGGGRGFYIGDDGAAYVNGDYHSGLDPSELGHTVGHEFGGHAAVNIMQAMGAKGGQLYTGLIGAARDALMPGGRPTADFYRFVKNYNRAFDPTGQTQRLDFQNPESIEEFLAEQAGQLMAAKGAGELALPKTIQDKISDGLGRYLGKVVGVDTDKVGTPTHFGREEVGKLSKLVQDTLGQVVGMKLRGGAEIPEPAKSADTRAAELQEILNRPKPPMNGSAEAVLQWTKDRAAARSELAKLQEGMQGAGTPASGPTPEAPSPPVVSSPPNVTADALKALSVMGIKGPKANALIRMANAQHGSPINDSGQLAAGAFRIHGGGEVKPGEFEPKQQAPAQPVPAPQDATFRDELGTTHKVTGAAPGAPRIGDIVATREGEIRRITRIAGDTVDTARPIDPLNARGTKTHKLADIQPLAHDYTEPGTSVPGATPEAAKPALTVQPKGDRFIVVDAAGNPVSNNTFATESAAQQSIRQQGKGKFSIFPNPTDTPDVIDTIQDRVPGIYFGGMSKEEAESFIQDKYLRDRLTTSNPAYGPDEVLRNIQPNEQDPIDHRVSSIAELGARIEEAYRQRKSLAAQQTAADKAAKTPTNGPTGTPTSPQNPPLPTGGTIAPPQPVAPVSPTPGTQPARPAAPSREAVDAIVASAEAKAVAAEKKPDTAAAQKRIHDAKVNAILDAIGDDPNGIHKVTMPDGSEKRVGDFDPENPYHQALANLGGGLSGAALDSLTKMQDAKGQTRFIRYRSALSSAENGPEMTDKSMTNRRAEYEANPASERTEGTIQHKAIIPVQTTMTKDGKPQSTFFVLDNLLHNAESVREFMGEHPELGKFPYKDEADLLRDAKTYADNHAHGWKGDGSGPMQRFPDSDLPQQDLNYKAETIPKDRFDVLNMMMHDEQAGKLADRTQEVADKQAKVAAAKTDKERERLQGVLDRTITRMKTSQEGYALGDLNNPWVDHQTGETNQFRAKLKAAGFDTNDALKSPFETLSPEHILDVSDNPIPMQEGDIPTVRPTGFSTGAESMAPMGKLNAKAVRAGFLPDTAKTTKERAQERIAARTTSANPAFMPDSTPSKEEPAPEGQGPSGSQPDRPSVGGTSKEDTGKPEDGQSQGERLMREAESAGLAPSLETMKGVLRGDADAMNKLRRMILDKSGRPARFLPGTRPNAKEAARQRIASRMAA